jgi:hypothetical protein
MESPENPLSEEEKKRRERQAFEAYFLNEKAKEEARNKKIITLVIIFGVGVPFVFSILYLIAMFALGVFENM